MFAMDEPEVNWMEKSLSSSASCRPGRAVCDDEKRDVRCRMKRCITCSPSDPVSSSTACTARLVTITPRTCLLALRCAIIR